LEDWKYYQSMALSHNPYGDGLAAKRIVNLLDGDSLEEAMAIACL